MVMRWLRGCVQYNGASSDPQICILCQLGRIHRLEHCQPIVVIPMHVAVCPIMYFCMPLGFKVFEECEFQARPGLGSDRPGPKCSGANLKWSPAQMVPRPKWSGAQMVPRPKWSGAQMVHRPKWSGAKMVPGPKWSGAQMVPGPKWSLGPNGPQMHLKNGFGA